MLFNTSSFTTSNSSLSQFMRQAEVIALESGCTSNDKVNASATGCSRARELSKERAISKGLDAIATSVVHATAASNELL